MTDQEMKLLHARLKKEDPKLLVLMEKCFDAGVLSGKEQAQRIWVGLTDEEVIKTFNAICNGKPFDVERILELHRAIEAKLKEKNT